MPGAGAGGESCLWLAQGQAVAPEDGPREAGWVLRGRREQQEEGNWIWHYMDLMASSMHDLKTKQVA